MEPHDGAIFLPQVGDGAVRHVSELEHVAEYGPSRWSWRKTAVGGGGFVVAATVEEEEEEEERETQE